MNRAALAAGACVALVVVAACGGDNGATPAGPQIEVADGGDRGDAAVGVPEVPPQPTDWLAGLAPAEVADENPDPNIVEVTLEAKKATVPIGAMQVEMWTYNGSVPGPILRARKGQRLIVHVRNALPEETLVHWHGVRVPNAMDGTPMVQTPIAPGGTFDYDFVVPDEGTYWYHSHVRSSAQVGFGLYGALVAEPIDGPAMPDVATMVLSDASVVDASQSLEAGDKNGSLGDFFGREGNHVLVNGREKPHVLARAGLPQRWRLVNAARARYFNLEFGAHRVFRIGADGGRIERPVEVKNLLLVPGERAELYVVPRGKPGESSAIANAYYDRFHAQGSGEGTDLFFVDLVADSAVAEVEPPATLTTVAPLDVTGATAQRIEFSQITIGETTALGINGKTGSEVPAVMASAGSVELWTVKNATGLDHPFHLHGFLFQVLSVNGSVPAVREWKDTVNLVPNDTFRIAIDFDQRPGMWMYHCHILDHADTGMMGMLHVH